MSNAILDWTLSKDGIAYQRCNRCGHVQYFKRDFCASCGNTDLIDAQARGDGIVHAVTTVYRAPNETLRAFAPYAIALIDMTEGFRLMAHAPAGTQIGDHVQAEFMDFGGTRIPAFKKFVS